MFTTKEGIIISLFFSLSIIPCIIAIFSHSIRLVCWLIIKDYNILSSISIILYNGIILSILLTVGFVIFNYAAGLFFSFSIINDKDIIGAFVITVFMMLISVMYLPIYKRIIRSTKQSAPSIFMWIALAVLFFVIMNYSTLLFISIIGIDKKISENAPILTLIIFLSAAYLLSYLIARRSLSLKLISTDDLAPWLFSH